MSLNATSLFIQASPIPATFQGTPNDLFTEMLKRMKILSPSGTNFIFIGDTEPSSNVGPWLKNGTQWYVWDPATKRYVPQDISASFTPAFVAGRSIPSTTNPPFWLQTTQDPPSTDPLNYGEMLRWYYFDGVRWLSPNPVEPNSKLCQIWLGSEQDLWAFDGGDGTDPSTNPPTDYTGAMWVVETAFQFRFPLGVGANTVGFDGNIPSAVAVQGKGGDERVALTVDELASHTHPIQNISNGITGGATLNFPLPDTGSPGTAPDQDTKPTGGDKTHQNMPPYIGVFFVKRSVRRYYTPA